MDDDVSASMASSLTVSLVDSFEGGEERRQNQPDGMEEDGKSEGRRRGERSTTHSTLTLLSKTVGAMAALLKVTVNQPPIPPQEDSGPTIPEPPKLRKKPHHQPHQPQEKLAPGLEKLKRPYINMDEVLRLGSILERRMKLTAEHRASFDWLAYTRTQDMQRMPEFFVHLQRSIGGVLLQPMFATESIEYLFEKKLLTPVERDAICTKIREMNPSLLTMYAVGELLRTESQVFRAAGNHLD